MCIYNKNIYNGKQIHPFWHHTFFLQNQNEILIFSNIHQNNEGVFPHISNLSSYPTDTSQPMTRWPAWKLLEWTTCSKLPNGQNLRDVFPPGFCGSVLKMAKKNPTKNVVNRWERSDNFSKIPATSSLKLVFSFQCVSWSMWDELTYLHAMNFFFWKSKFRNQITNNKIEKKWCWSNEFHGFVFAKAIHGNDSCIHSGWTNMETFL